jgi:3-deoxy-D-manno-octulosonic-acid transferase
VGYLKFAKLAKSAFSNLTHVAAQYDSDKQNFIQLGVTSEKISLVGNIKFDLQIDEPLKQRQQLLKQQWAKERLVWLAASIHPDEFDAILEVHRALIKKYPKLLLIGVPRHPEKFDEFKQACQRHQFEVVNRSEATEPHEQTQVVVGDTMGEVLLFSGIADITFVGGSLIERGGHNPLEPIVCGSPVVMGKHYENFKDICQVLLSKSALKVADSADDLTSILDELFSSPTELDVLSTQSLAVIQENQGCVDKLVESINSTFR